MSYQQEEATIMANQTSRGGKKQGRERQATGKRHQGVRKGSTATRKEQRQQSPRKSAINGHAETGIAAEVASLDERTWMLVASASKARLVACQKGEWTTVGTFAHLDSRRTGNELNEVAGRQKSPGAGHRLSIERFDPHELEKVRFAQILADNLVKAAKKKSFDHLILVAAPRFLGEVQSHLPERVADCVLAVLPKDLTKVGERELCNRLEQELMRTPKFKQALRGHVPQQNGEKRAARISRARTAGRPPRSDGELALRVHELLSCNPRIAAEQIEVTVHAGEVTLHGTVATAKARDLAEETVKSAPKVEQVNNQLTVKS